MCSLRFPFRLESVKPLSSGRGPRRVAPPLTPPRVLPLQELPPRLARTKSDRSPPSRKKKAHRSMERDLWASLPMRRGTPLSRLREFRCPDRTRTGPVTRRPVPSARERPTASQIVGPSAPSRNPLLRIALAAPRPPPSSRRKSLGLRGYCRGTRRPAGGEHPGQPGSRDPRPRPRMGHGALHQHHVGAYSPSPSTGDRSGNGGRSRLSRRAPELAST